MSGYLLDANVALRAAVRSSSLSAGARGAIRRGPNYLSVVSYWEVVLKSLKGKLNVGDPRNWWLETLDQLAATPLPLRPNHITEICNLPPIHQDPFDRALIAQATVEDLTLVTTGGAIAEYAGERFRVLQ